MKKIKWMYFLAIVFIAGCAKDELQVENQCDESEYQVPLKSGNINPIVSDNGITADELAYHWAPVHYQDINPAYNDQSQVDYIIRIDRNLGSQEGGLWDLSANWDKKMRYPLNAYVYYSVVSTESHFYIGYYFFHAWDTQVTKKKLKCKEKWGIPYDCKLVKERHEWETNDMEGALFVIKRDGGVGNLEAVIVQGHGFLHTYLTNETKNSFDPKHKRPTTISFSNEAMGSMNDDVYRVITAQHAEGHGFGCYPEWHAPGDNPVADEGGGDHIRYIPSRIESEVPNYALIHRDENGKEKSGMDRFVYCKYKLINVFDADGGFWAHRNEPNVFEWTSSNRLTFIGHSTPPWNWRGNKEHKNPFYKGEPLNLTDEEEAKLRAEHRPFTHFPADLAQIFLKTVDTNPNDYFSEEYEFNIFQEDMLNGN